MRQDGVRHLLNTSITMRERTGCQLDCSRTPALACLQICQPKKNNPCWEHRKQDTLKEVATVASHTLAVRYEACRKPLAAQVVLVVKQRVQCLDIKMPCISTLYPECSKHQGRDDAMKEKPPAVREIPLFLGS